MQKQKNKQRGVTLIALVVSIIVLIILAGVSIAMLVGDNGIITMAQQAKEDTKQAQERESIQLAVLQASLESKIENGENSVGIPLYYRTIENGNRWHILTNKNDGTIYGTGWNYVKANTEIPGYGVTEQSWLVNNQTGEIVAINDDEYTETYYGMNLAVTEGLLLNVDPVNMQDENSWGNGVTLYGVTSGDGYGYNGDAILLDGVDDYIEIYADTPIEEGFTFEFYGRTDDDTINMLSKTVLEDTADYAKRFRVRFTNETTWFRASFSGVDSESDWATINITTKHWIDKKLNNSFNAENGTYFTMTANLETNTISLYINGEFQGSTVCNHEWLISGQLTDITVPFTIGLLVYGQVYTPKYSAMELYACRLYDRVLSEEEITDNYETTVAYRGE